MHSAQQTQAFLYAADKWLCDSYALDVRYIALGNQEKWEIAEASISLLPLPHGSDTSFAVTTPALRAGQHLAYPLTKAKAMAALAAGASGTLELDDLTLTLANPQDLDIYSEMSFRDRWFSPLHLRVAARRASSPGPSQVASLDAALRQAEPPFDGTTDLAGWLGLNADFSGSQAPAITIAVAPPIDVILGQSSLTSDTLRATLHAHANLDLKQVGFAVRAAPGEGIGARRQIANSIVWSDPVDNLRIGQVEVTLPNSDSVLVMLSLGSETVRRQWIVDPQRARNSRFIAINQFDVELRKMRQALLDSPESRKFEQAVSALLHMLGFSSALPLETDAPDLVATTPSGQMVLIECTTRLADFATKSGKLVERRSALSKSLSAANLPASVIAVLVCRLPRDEIAASTNDLRERNILLLTAEDIESAIARARFVVDPDALLQEALASLTSAGRLE